MLKINSIIANAKKAIIKKQHDKIYAHEMAHKAKAGSLGGAIIIEKDKDGIPVAGHVAISMPILDKNNPQATIYQARKVIDAALAPVDPSAQDYKVADEARKILSEAQQYTLDYLA